SKPHGQSVENAAERILRVSNANMVDAARLISVERGRDPRDYALMAFGGAGPVHAAYCAAELNIPTVVVPRNPGLASAFGQLRVEIRDDYQRALLRKHSELEPAFLARAFAELEAQALETLLREGLAEHEISLERTVDVKYYPQTTYLNLSIAGPDSAVTQ